MTQLGYTDKVTNPTVMEVLRDLKKTLKILEELVDTSDYKPTYAHADRAEELSETMREISLLIRDKKDER